MQVVSRSFPYLVDSKEATGGGEVGKLVFHVWPVSADIIDVAGLRVEVFDGEEVL